MKRHAAASANMIVLDRDGTIVVDRGYLSNPDGLEFLPGAAEGLARFHNDGYRLIVISNQSGIGRGYFSHDAQRAMNARLDAMVNRAGARLQRIYYCPHRPEDECRCRKPELGLMRRAISELGFDPRMSFVIGDRASDMEFGRRAGAHTTLISTSRASESLTQSASLISANLLQAYMTISKL